MGELKDSMAKPFSFTWNLLCGLQQVPLLLWALASFFFFFFGGRRGRYRLINPCGSFKMSRPAAFAPAQESPAQIPVVPLPAANAGGLCHILKMLSMESTFLLTCEVPQSTPPRLALSGAFLPSQL